MSFNSFGETLRITTFGESHGKAIGAIIDGVRPGLPLDAQDIQRDLDRRRPGQSKYTTSRPEKDGVQILSGIFEGKTTGSSICLIVYNREADSSAYDALKDVFRPGHADLTFWSKYGIRDHRGGGRASGRETVARVAAGAIARKILANEGISVQGFVRQIGDVTIETLDLQEIERNPLRCPDAEAAVRMGAAIDAARDDGDSLGGVVEIRASGVPKGLGDPVFAKLDAQLASALMSIGAVKGVEIGDGFALTRMRGSESNDPISPSGFVSNRHGGVLGGISSGADVVARIAVKPTSSIAKPQNTITKKGESTTLEVHGRHDPCICPRIVPVAEAMLALVLADALLRQRAVSGTQETKADRQLSRSRLDRAILECVAQRRTLDSLGEREERKDEGAAFRAIGAEMGLDSQLIDDLFELLERRGEGGDG